MRETKPDITVFVKDQFPQFYQDDGSKFIAFVEAYYAWLAEENNIDYLTDRIYSLRDIDNTIDDFVLYFKNKYLAGLSPNSETDMRKLVKHAVEIFGTKGTERSLKLLFQLLYGEEINIYYPGNDVIRASDGKWFQPRYLELTPAEKTASFISKQVTGTSSGAKAFIEGLVRKTINGRIFDVAFISGIRGNFEAGERITVDGNVASCPIVTGSLVDVFITNGGANAAIGDILTISGGSGYGGVVRVTGIDSATGKVTFTLHDGGSGYRMTSNVLVSDSVLQIDDYVGTFDELETVTQPLQRVGYISGSGTLANVAVEGLYSNGVTASTGVILTSNATHIIVNVTTGDFADADDLETATPWTAAIANTANIDATGIFLGYNANNDHIGLYNTSNTFYANASLIGELSNATATVVTILTGTDATFEIGSLTDEYSALLWTDLLDDVNEEGVPFMDIILDGSNANTAGNTYGFEKPVTGYTTTIDSLIFDALDNNTFSIGTIASLTSINPGQDYNANPFIMIYDPLIAGFNRRNIIVDIENATGTFVPGELIEQVVTLPGWTLEITYVANSPFDADESVVQEVTDAKGVINTVNATHINITSLNGVTFSVGDKIIGMASDAYANVTANTFAGINSVSGGFVVTANLNSVTIKPATLNEVFDGTGELVGDLSGITADVISISIDSNSRPMGWNANVSGNVITANGVISQIAIIDSGYGYLDGEEVELVNEDNPIIAVGELEIDEHGIGEGYWKNTDGFVGSDKYIHDNHYYQSYSYEIQTGIALERYSTMLKRGFHTAGMIYFGKVVKVSVPDISSIDISSTVTTS